jgi:hypothetical protein
LKSTLSTSTFFNNVYKLLSDSSKTAMNEIRKLLNKIRKKVLKNIAYSILNKNPECTINESNIQIHDLICDIIDTKLFKPSVINNT